MPRQARKTSSGDRGLSLDTIEIAKFSPEERQDYEESVKIYRDLKNSLNTAEWKAKVQIAREMKADGIPIVTIMKYTKLPLEEIERL